MDNFSLQLFSIRDCGDMQKRLEMAAKAGYTGVEFAGYDGIAAPELKAMLKGFGLRATGTHIGYNLLESDLDACVEYCVQAGIATATCPGYGMDGSDREDIRHLTEFLEHCSERFAKEGIPFFYHNHSAEFRLMDGKPILHWMLEDSELLKSELDVFWAAKAGFDPLAFSQEHAGRIGLFHFKDIDSNGDNVELGTGYLDFCALKEWGEKNGVLEYIVEQEMFIKLPPEQSILANAVYMKSL